GRRDAPRVENVHLCASDYSPGNSRTRGRARARLGSCAWRVWSDDHVRGQSARRDTDYARCCLCHGPDRSGCSDRGRSGAHGAILRRAPHRASRGEQRRRLTVMLDVDMEARAGSTAVACRFDVRPGSAVALVGASGAGKTTVLRAIAGLVHPQRGRIVCDQDTWFDAQRRIWVAPQQRDCAFVFAEYALFGHMSVIENVAFGLRASGYDRKSARKKSIDALERINAA